MVDQHDFVARAKERFDARTRTVAEATRQIGLPPEAFMDVFSVLYGDGEAQALETGEDLHATISVFRGRGDVAQAAGGEGDVEAWEIALLVNADTTSPLTPQQIGIDLFQLRDGPIMLRVQPHDWPDGLRTLQIAITLDLPTDVDPSETPSYLEPWVRAHNERIVEMDADARYVEVQVGCPEHPLTHEEREALMRFLPTVILAPRHEA